MNTAEVRTALKSLPVGRKALSSAYDNAMRRILVPDTGVGHLARKTLSWITYAERLLTVTELQHALGIQYGASGFNEDTLYDIDGIVSACAGLVTVENSQQTVRLVHYSTQEFLRQTGDVYFPDAQRDIATGCLTYLLYDSFGEGWRSNYPGTHNVAQQHPFLLYAAQYWPTHASRCSEQSVRNLILQFMRESCRVSSAAQVLFNLKIHNHKERDTSQLRSGMDSQAGDLMSGMHLAAYFGVENMVLMLLQNGFAVDVRDAFNRSPLFWASRMGHTAVVDLVLSFNENQSDLKSRGDGPDGHVLATVGDLKHEADYFGLPEPFDFDTAISSDQQPWRATDDGCRAALKLPPMVNGVDVNSQDSRGTTPLYAAVQSNHPQVVAKLLSQLSILPDLVNQYGSSPLRRRPLGDMGQ